ncbi:MAG: DEAD/DEAH box helicase family protein [Planctomycetia bacterium]|nr:DEAD/DEAH box helicase family protein [Planctomycetia bacterium]
MVRPKLETAGWLANGERHYREQLHVTAGRVVLAGCTAKRLKQKIPDYLLYFTRDVPLAVVEAKSNVRPAGDGLQQAKDYAQLLGLKFAYATNGTDIIEYDYFTHLETVLTAFPSPTELWQRYQLGMGFASAVRDALLVPDFYRPDKLPRYYQRRAIDAALRAIVGGQKRCLLTMATGTGKTIVAFQICWKLWSAKWNAKNDPTRKPRILFLADRDKLVSDPMGKDFAPFGHARHRISGKAEKGREMYFALYQALSGDETRPGLYRDYPPDYFDLIVIDECHRGSANDEGRWRDILEYFEPAHQLGMTATPLREDNRDTYTYFHNPLYTYSLKQGIEDGFLAPYRVHRIVTSFDAAGWRPNKGQKDRNGEVIPDRLYTTKDFERVVSVDARNKIVAQHITDFLKATDRYAKTIVFCVDQDHADIMRRELSNLNTDLADEATAAGSSYVARVTADEGDIGGGFLDAFQDPEKKFPVILTTSQLLTTGVDAPTCKNVVLFRMVNSMTEFKQIIGRGTRLREDHGKLFFHILDYNGSANERFADPDFDGEPAQATQEEIDEAGNVTVVEVHCDPEQFEDDTGRIIDPYSPGRVKLRVHGGPGGIAAVVTHDLAADGTKLRTADLSAFTGEEVRGVAPDATALRAMWSKPVERSALLKALDERGIDLHILAAEAGQPEADEFDLLAHLAYNAPLRTRAERAAQLRTAHALFFAGFAPPAREVLNAILDKFAEHGVGQFNLDAVLQVKPLSDFGTVTEIAERFGGADKLLDAVDRMQELLYAN